jgi:hypothetical protein
MPGAALDQMCATVFFGIDVNASNVPGPPLPLWCAGAAVTGISAIAPRTGSAFSATLISYDGRATVALNMDRGAVPEREELVAQIRKGFALVTDEEPNR